MPITKRANPNLSRTTTAGVFVPPERSPLGGVLASLQIVVNINENAWRTLKSQQ
jgi:hypothetical protein